MGRVTHVRVGLRRLYALPNFENFTIEGAVEAEVDFDETPAEAAAALMPVLREQMKATFNEFKPKAKEKSR